MPVSYHFAPVTDRRKPWLCPGLVSRRTVNREDAVVASQDESHYARAKYLVGRKNKHIGTRLPGGHLREATEQEIAQAQVYATLALADVMRELLSELVAGRQRESDTQV
jgi:hypothetical protein